MSYFFSTFHQQFCHSYHLARLSVAKQEWNEKARVQLRSGMGIAQINANCFDLEQKYSKTESDFTKNIFNFISYFSDCKSPCSYRVAIDSYL